MSKLKVAEKSYDVAEDIVAIKFTDGTTLDLNPSTLPEEIRTVLMFHGLIQKLGDSYAGALEAVESGEAVNATQWAKEQVQRVMENLKAGIWATRESGPSQLARAIAEATGGDAVKIHEALKDWEAVVEAGKAKGASPAEVEAGKRAKAKITAARSNGRVKEILARFAKEALARRIARLGAEAAEAGTEGLEDFE